MDSLTTSIDFDQSFQANWRAELVTQNSLDFDESANLNLSQSIRLDPNTPEITHYIKQYKDQLETLQKDNFSLKLQIFYFQRAFENAGLAEFPDSSECKEGFSELEKEFTDNKKLLGDANLAITQLTDQNKELHRKLSKLEKKFSESKNKFEELSTVLEQKDAEFDELNENFIGISHENKQLGQRCESIIDHVQRLESEIAFLKAKSVEETEYNLGDAQKLAEAEENARFYQEKNAQVVEFAKPLAQKLQETQELLEVSDQRCEKLHDEMKKADGNQKVFSEKFAGLERELLELKNKNANLTRQNNELSNFTESLEQKNAEISGESSQNSSKIKDYEIILDSLHQRINENAKLLADQDEEIAAKNREIKAKSHLEESLIQAKSIISKLESQLQTQNNEILSLEDSKNDELVALKQKYFQIETRLDEKELNFAKLKAENAALLLKELDKSGLIKQQNEVLIEEINAFRSIKKRDFTAQTKLTMNELKQSEREISELQKQIKDLVVEKSDLVRKQGEISNSEMRNLTHQNEELKDDVSQLKGDLELSNLRVMELEEHLKLVGTLSKPEKVGENSPLTIDSENIQSILSELVDQLSETRSSLEISLTNESQMRTNLKDLKDKYAMISNEKGRIMNKLQQSEEKNQEISLELERKKASFGSKLQSANQHLKELQHVFLPSPNTKTELAANCADNPNGEGEDKNNSTVVPQALKQSGLSTHEIGDLDVTLPDDLFRLAVSSDSKNISLLLSIYKELLTTHKYLSRANQYALPTQKP